MICWTSACWTGHLVPRYSRKLHSQFLGSAQCPDRDRLHSWSQSWTAPFPSQWALPRQSKVLPECRVCSWQPFLDKMQKPQQWRELPPYHPRFGLSAESNSGHRPQSRSLAQLQNLERIIQIFLGGGNISINLGWEYFKYFGMGIFQRFGGWEYFGGLYTLSTRSSWHSLIWDNHPDFRQSRIFLVWRNFHLQLFLLHFYIPTTTPVL